MNKIYKTFSAEIPSYPKAISTEKFDIELGPYRGSYNATTYDDGSVWVGRLPRNRREATHDDYYPSREEYELWRAREDMRHLE